MAPGAVSYALLAYGTWGVAPLFWKPLLVLRADVLFALRVVFSALALGSLLMLARRGHEFIALLRTPGLRQRFALSAMLLATNWLVFLYSVSTNQLVESSFGYFINPLVNVALGTVLLGERLSRVQRIAVVLAGLGVLLLGLRLHGIPWIALMLGVSFGFYGLVRKTAKADAVVGSSVEIVLLLPFALAYLAYCVQHPGAAPLLPSMPGLWIWLICAGYFSSLPLLWFTRAAQGMPLSTLGLFQYIAPSLQLLLAVLLYGEPFTAAHVQSFALIWSALALTTYETRRARA